MFLQQASNGGGLAERAAALYLLYFHLNNTAKGNLPHSPSATLDGKYSKFAKLQVPLHPTLSLRVGDQHQPGRNAAWFQAQARLHGGCSEDQTFLRLCGPPPPPRLLPPSESLKCADFLQGQASAALHFSPRLNCGSEKQASRLCENACGGVSTRICFSVAAD